jgi:hypothetical protein
MSGKDVTMVRDIANGGRAAAAVPASIYVCHVVTSRHRSAAKATGRRNMPNKI